MGELGSEGKERAYGDGKVRVRGGEVEGIDVAGPDL